MTTDVPAAVLRLTPAAMTDRIGVSIDTLRYYERKGLLDGIDGAQRGHRRYTEDDVLWVQVLRCLRETGMSTERSSKRRSLNVRLPLG